jgi:hypothetical protein
MGINRGKKEKIKYLLIGGAQDVGKTGAIYRLAHYLVDEKKFPDVLQSIPKVKKDFKAIVDGKDKNGKNIRIAINSETDTRKTIKSFKTFLDENKNITLVISSIRDNGSYPREEFFDIMGITENDIDIELPLAKITRRKKRRVALRWYENKIDTVLKKLLEESYLG